MSHTRWSRNCMIGLSCARRANSTFSALPTVRLAAITWPLSSPTADLATSSTTRPASANIARTKWAMNSHDHWGWTLIIDGGTWACMQRLCFRISSCCSWGAGISILIGGEVGLFFSSEGTSECITCGKGLVGLFTCLLVAPATVILSSCT